MEVIKVECDDYLQEHVNIDKIQNDEQWVISNKQLRDLEAKEQLDGCKDEPFSTESIFDSTQESDTHNECINEAFFKQEENSSSNDQLHNKVKQEIDNELDTNDALFNEELKINAQENNDAEICEQEEVKLVQKRKRKKTYMRVNTNNSQFQVYDDLSKFYKMHCSLRQNKLQRTNSIKKSKLEECRFCDYTTEDMLQLINHAKNIHQRFICVLCEFVSPVEFCLKRHMTIEHPKFNQVDLKPKSYTCSRCDFFANTAIRVKLHEERVHLRLKRHKCNLCDFRGFSKTDLKRHVNGVHLKVKKFKCQSCPFSSGSSEHLEKHMIAVHLNLEQYKCHLCDFKTALKNGLRRHINLVHMKMKTFKCTYCEYATYRPNRLKNHINEVHLRLKNFKCHMCSYRAARKTQLASHVNAVHLHLHTDNCHSCKKVDRKVSSNAHAESEHKKYQCSHCGFRTVRSTVLRDHVNAIHLKLRNYKCGFCDYSASMRTSLRNHVAAIHFKLKNHECKFCDYRANRKAQLDAHVDSVHLNLKKYSCISCYFNAKKRQLLEENQGDITSNFECSLCNQVTDEGISR